MNPFLVESVYLKIMSGFMDNETINTNGFSQICVPSSEMGLSHEDNEPSIAKKRKPRNGSGSSPNSAQSKEVGVEEKGKKKKQKQCNGEEAKSGYIHVRARRGQATDSHSLAERARREKISERMKILQGLVPGCDKVTGKALMLDEIINYVQSLQNQVEFLSMKLASVNPMFYDFSNEQGSFMHMITPEEGLNSMHASALQQCSPNEATVFADTPPTIITYNNTSAFSQEHDFQDNAGLLWDVE